MKIYSKENHEVIINKDRKSSDLYFGLSGTGVNTTKASKKTDTRIKEDLNLK